jgi:predicted AlkP superfamily phosphohydrolase/phosphomutase
MADRVLVIGLDGATWRSLDPLVESGAMPSLARLRRRGFVAPLESTVPPVTAPAWSSFITGQNPGRHGVYQFYEIDPWSERALGRGTPTFLAEPGVIVNGKALGGPKLWEVASSAGKRCATINLPMTYPPSPINGLMVTDMLTPPGSRNFTYPPELADELTDYEIDLTPREKDFSSSDEAFLARAEAVLEKRGRAVTNLFEREPWDLFVAIFTETDRLQHRYWQYLDPEPPPGTSRELADIRMRVVGLYTQLDAYLGRLLDAAADEYRIVVVSDHGFGHAATRRVNMQALAAALGLGGGAPASNRLARFGITNGASTNTPDGSCPKPGYATRSGPHATAPCET